MHVYLNGGRVLSDYVPSVYLHLFSAEEEVGNGHMPVVQASPRQYYYAAIVADESFKRGLATKQTPLEFEFHEISSLLQPIPEEAVQTMRAALQNVIPHPQLHFPSEIWRVINAMYPYQQY